MFFPKILKNCLILEVFLNLSSNELHLGRILIVKEFPGNREPASSSLLQMPIFGFFLFTLKKSLPKNWLAGWLAASVAQQLEEARARRSHPPSHFPCPDVRRCRVGRSVQNEAPRPFINAASRCHVFERTQSFN